jgi:hypothetical protein
MDMTLKLRRVFDDGGAAYVTEGIRGTIYVKAGFFGGLTPPDELMLSGEGLATPVIPKAPEVTAQVTEVTQTEVTEAPAAVAEVATEEAQPEERLSRREKRRREAATA